MTTPGMDESRLGPHPLPLLPSVDESILKKTASFCVPVATVGLSSSILEAARVANWETRRHQGSSLRMSTQISLGLHDLRLWRLLREPSGNGTYIEARLA